MIELPGGLADVPDLRQQIRTTPIVRACLTVEQLPLCVNLHFYQGDDFSVIISVTNQDGHHVELEECSARSQIRETPDAQAIAAEFDVQLYRHWIILHLPSSATAPLLRHTVTSNQGVWDCELIDWNGWTTTLVAGSVTVVPQVTR